VLAPPWSSGGAVLACLTRKADICNACPRERAWPRMKRISVMAERERPSAREYVFTMDAYTLDTIPMNRLAEYMADLAIFMGEHKSVHFSRLSPGSVALVCAVEHEAEPKVLHRMQVARSGDGPPDAVAALRRINRRLAGDNAEGRLAGPDNNNVHKFPGKHLYGQAEFGPIRQFGTLDGIPIKLGGERSRVPVHLDNRGGERYICHASREIAREIAPHIFEQTIRVEGYGKWMRDREGEWILGEFNIAGFHVLDDEPLRDTVHKLRALNRAAEGQGGVATLEWLRHGTES